MIRLSRPTLFGLGVIVVALIAYVSLELAFPIAMNKSHLLDFDAFYLASTMIAEGNLAGAYQVETFVSRQATMLGSGGNTLLWSYPPPYDLVVMPLAPMPSWLAYVVFMISTLALYLYVVRNLAGAYFHLVFVLFLPLILLIIRSGQNSFLTGAFIGFTCLLALRQSKWAGLPLGLLAIKPHLALGVGIWAILDRRWGLVTLSLLTVGFLSVLSTIVFTTNVWDQSFAAISETGKTLQSGQFILYRMTSIYTFGLSIGLGHQVSMMLHAIVAFAALFSLLVLSRLKLPTRVFMGAGVLVSALISPYCYDYDLAMLAVAVCLLIETILSGGTKLERNILIAGTLFVVSYGLAMTAIIDLKISPILDKPISIVGPILLVLEIVVLRIVLRRKKSESGAVLSS